jgi:hypothetical protein
MAPAFFQKLVRHLQTYIIVNEGPWGILAQFN